MEMGAASKLNKKRESVRVEYNHQNQMLIEFVSYRKGLKFQTLKKNPNTIVLDSFLEFSGSA